MSTRKIIVFSSKTNSKIELTIANTPTIDTINTWGALKPLVSSLIGNDMIATSVQTRSTLSSDSSVITFDSNNVAQIVLTPAKVKSGNESTVSSADIAEFEACLSKLNDILARLKSNRAVSEDEMSKIAGIIELEQNS